MVAFESLGRDAFQEDKQMAAEDEVRATLQRALDNNFITQEIFDQAIADYHHGYTGEVLESDIIQEAP